MAQPAVESMSGSEDRAPANPDDTAAPDSKGETVLQDSVKDMLKDEEHEEENDMLGTKVLAGEFQAHDPGDDTRPFDVVAVHGLCGDREATWTVGGNDQEPASNWLHHKIHTQYPKSRILTFGYDASDTKAGISTAAGIRENALKLLDDLVKLRKEMGQDDVRPIVFVTHDVGGIIVKQALWIATIKHRKYGSIAYWTRLIIFFGCPHRCNSTRHMEDMIANLFFANSNSRPVGAMGRIESLAKSIIDINGFFALSKMLSLLEIVNVYSEEKTPILQIFDKYTSTFEVAFEERIASPKSHNDLCKFPQFDEFCKAIDQVLSSCPSKPGDPAISRLQAFQTLAAPVYPIESMYSPGNHFNWVPKHDTYTKWLGSYGPSILHVHGASRISQVSDYIFQSLDDYATGTTKREIVINFKFDRDNDQCNSIVAMLTTFLARVFAHSEVMRDYVALVFEQMSFYSSWTQSELFIMFRQVLGHNSHGGFLFVIDGLDQCDDSRTPFLEELCNFLHNTEHHIKIVVTSTTDSTIQATLADWPTINLDDHPEIPEMTRNHLVSDVDLEVLELTQERPLFYGFEKLIAEKLLKCGHDSQWRRLVLNELRLSHTSITTSATRQKLESSSPTTPKDTFAQILERVSSERQPWARKALVWILYAFRPLKTWELGVALALEFDDLSNPEAELDKFGHQYVVANIDEIFGGMFVIKHHEIRPGHPEVRDFFTAMHGANVWYDVTEKAHQEITEACCSYLVLPQVQDSIATNHDDQPPIVGHSAGDTKYLVNTHSPSINNSHQYSFSSYAARYWPRHYKLIPQIFQATQPITRFLEDTNAFRRWSEADWWLSNPISRRDRGFLSSSLLPIFAGLGLKDLMKVSEAVGTYERALALTEAARNGYIEVIRMLLPYGGYDQSHIQQALVAGASCGNEMLLEELVTYAAKTIENFEWPPALLCRAATFSYESLAAKLIKFGASTNSPSIQGMTPLHFAVRQKQIGVVKLLLDNKAELSLTTTNVTSPLHIASIYGNPAAVKLLLDAGADVDSKDEYSLTAVYLACWHHRYRAVEVLVEAGADLSNDTKGEWTPLTAAGRMEILKCAQILLEHKANVDVEGFRNWTPLRYATAQGNLELSKLFLKYGADPNTLSGTLTSGTEPILGEPVRQGNLAMVTILVEKGAKVNAVSSEQWTPLLNASSAGKDDVVAYLLDHRADIDHANSTGHTAVILAAYSSFPKIVELLIEKGADIHRATSNGWTALHFAYDDMETTRVLMKYGADPNRIADFYTPLFLAAASNYTEAVKVLISFQADLEIEYANPTLHTGYTALCVATASEHIETVRVLLEAGANVNHQTTNNYFSLQFPVIDNNLELLRTLMEYNPDLNLVDDDGDTALHCIKSTTSVEVAKLLVNGGANIEIVNKSGYTVLAKAIEVENFDISKYLISKKAKINFIDGKLGGILHLAVRTCPFQFVEILLTAKADVNLVDPFAGTPVQDACRRWIGDDKGEIELREKILRHLIIECKADISIVGGLFGCALNGICIYSTPEMIKLALDKGARIDVRDEMGRVAVHFAAMNGLENFQPIRIAGADVEAKDGMGRTTLHWAVIGGQIDVIERVLSLSRGLLDQADIDGWTPLLWASRGCGTSRSPATSSMQENIIKLLLKRGANPCVKGKGIDREWSPVKVARYHGADDSIIDLLTSKAKEKGDWDEEAHVSQKAAKQQGACDGCFYFMYGIRYKCQTCPDFDFCYKCFNSKHLIHANHAFTEMGAEYEAPDDKKSSEEDEDTDDDSDEEKDEEQPERQLEVKQEVEADVDSDTDSDSEDTDDDDE